MKFTPLIVTVLLRSTALIVKVGIVPEPLGGAPGPGVDVGAGVAVGPGVGLGPAVAVAVGTAVGSG